MTASSSSSSRRLVLGCAVGLLAAAIGALYTVYARWGIARGMGSPDLTAIRFSTAGLITLPVLGRAMWNDRSGMVTQWRVWLLVSVLAGTPFGLLMFGALQLAPSSHAAILPFAAMSVMGMLLSAWVLGDPLTARRVSGIVVVVLGLVLLSGVTATAFSGRVLLGDLMFVAAGTLWVGFGIVLRRHRLDPLLATAVIAFSALLTYVPCYLLLGGGRRLIQLAPSVLAAEVLVQGVIAGAGTLYTYAKMVSILGAARAAVFPALAPGLAALMAWPVLGQLPTLFEAGGLFIAMAGLFISVTQSRHPTNSR